jgi:glycerol-3-phosphate dehydrogenase
LCCVYAIGRNILLGATEMPVADPDRSRASPAEDAYLLAALRGLFPGAEVSNGDIVARLHGVRPLVAVAGDDVTGRSRDHAIHTHRASPGGPPLVSIAGGKWTTFRAIAEDAANVALAVLDRPRVASTERRPIGGGRDGTASAEALTKRHCLSAGLAERLIATYGTRASRVAAYLDDERGRRPIAGGALTVGEVAFLAREEMATSAEDIARRRSRLFLEGLATSETLREIERALASLSPDPAQEVLQHAPV